ncbi:MAG: YggS family pyridoxal phosphate-dependent enzyme [Planctomycetota bacterium]|jgi:pyridoxal phosphate enzyme (YggS family)
MKRKLADNLKNVRQRIQAACHKSGRNPKNVRLVAVTKYIEPDIIRTAIDVGLTDFGESRVQELTKRAGMIQEHLNRRRLKDKDKTPPDPDWHMVGHLQRNKVRAVVPWVKTIHSLDSLRLAEEISVQASKFGKTVSAMIEVNVSGEKTKYGIAVGAAAHLATHIANLPGLRIIGLMTMAPYCKDPQEARPHFRRLREILEDMQAETDIGPQFRELSMGMSNDFEVAIEEGATTVRIGTTLFEGFTSKK